MKRILMALGGAILLLLFGLYLWNGLMALVMTGHLWRPYARRLPITGLIILLALAVWAVWSRSGRHSRH